MATEFSREFFSENRIVKADLRAAHQLREEDIARIKAEVKKLLGSEAGVYSYLGTRDFRAVEDRAFSGDAEARLIFDALVYQHCKDIGAMGAVLSFRVDGIVLTGGMANSKRLCAAITERVGALAPVLVLPGEAEMEALALGALRVLRGEPAREY